MKNKDIQNKPEKLFHKKADFIAATIMCAICLIAILPKFLFTKKHIAYIYIDGKEVKKIDLSSVVEPEIIYLECSPKVALKVKKNCIRFYKTECDDKRCINSGWLTEDGDLAVCMPATVVVRIEG